MRRPSYLIRRDGRYCLRLRVPDCLQSVLGLKEIRRALGTADPRRARVLAATTAAPIWEAMEGIRMATDDKEIDAAKSALLDLLQRKSDAAKNLAAEALRSVELQKRVIALKDELASETLAQSEQERRALTMVTAKAMAGLTPPDPFAALHLQARRPWWELIETFFDEVKQTPANRANYMREFNRLADVIGRDRPLGLIRFDDLDKHHDALLLKAKPRKGNTTLSSKSQQRCLSHLKTFFSWAYGKEWLDRDPSKALRVKGLTRRETKEIKRRSFSPNELGLLAADHGPVDGWTIERADPASLFTYQLPVRPLVCRLSNPSRHRRRRWLT